MKNALKRMKIQQFFKKNRTAQNLYDKAMGAVDLGYGAGMGAASAALAPQLMAGSGLYTGPGLYTGMGEYQPSSNELIRMSDSSVSKSSLDIVPQFSQSSDSGILISKREYVAEIYGPPSSSAFQIQSFPLNPGLEGTFPWLSQIAQNYDEYELVQCVFTFKSTTTESVNSANGQVGTVLMATAYNAAQPNFTDKVSMMQYEFSNSSRLTESMLHGVECDPTKLSGSPGQYIRNNPVVVGQDLKTYDHGKFQLAIANCASAYFNQSIGELWVSYTVRLRKSKFYTALGLGISKDIFVSNGGELNNAILGTSILRGQQNNIGVLISQTVPNRLSITFPASYKGTVKVQLMVGRGVVAGVAQNYTAINVFQSFTNTGNITNVADLYGDQLAADTPVASAQICNVGSGGIAILHIAVNIATNGVNNTLGINYDIQGTAVPSQVYLEIAEYNSGFSYAATGLAPVGVEGADAPVFVNSSGVVTIPNS